VPVDLPVRPFDQAVQGHHVPHNQFGHGRGSFFSGAGSEPAPSRVVHAPGARPGEYEVEEDEAEEVAAAPRLLLGIEARSAS
jgi:hypothetical protein